MPWQGLATTRCLGLAHIIRAGDAAATLHERVLLDIQRSLDNFDRNHSAIPLNRLLVGPLPEGDVFVDYLATNLTMPVSRADLGDVLNIGAAPQLKKMDLQAEGWFAIGAALREP